MTGDVTPREGDAAVDIGSSEGEAAIEAQLLRHFSKARPTRVTTSHVTTSHATTSHVTTPPPQADGNRDGWITRDEFGTFVASLRGTAAALASVGVASGALPTLKPPPKPSPMTSPTPDGARGRGGRGGMRRSLLLVSGGSSANLELFDRYDASGDAKLDLDEARSLLTEVVT